MTTASYMGTIAKSYVDRPVPAPQNTDPSSGASKAASQGVIGNDPAVTATLPFQPIGGTPVAGTFVTYVPPIPT